MKNEKTKKTTNEKKEKVVKKVKTTKETKNSSIKTTSKLNANKDHENKEIVVHKTNRKKYIGYSQRLFLSIFLFLIFFAICLFFSSKTFEKEKQSPVKYSEKRNVNYRVYLNNNPFYDKDYLDMDKAYVASLIKNIDVNFNYKFKITELSNISFDYKIIGELIIENNNGTNRYFEKKYTLLDNQAKKLENGNNFDIKENIKIDYGYYNQLANNFRSAYGVDTNSYLNLYMEINSNSSEKLNYKINDVNKILLKIPLSEKAVEIKFDQNNGEITKQVVREGNIIFNKNYLILEIIFLLLTIYFFLKTVKYIVSIMKKNTKYDKFVNNILKEYDRLIVETNTDIDLKKYNIIEIKKFTELLDVRDNLKCPILYYCITKHYKGMFYIKNNDDIYLLIVKDIDLNNR